jgi:surface antigen
MADSSEEVSYSGTSRGADEAKGKQLQTPDPVGVDIPFGVLPTIEPRVAAVPLSAPPAQDDYPEPFRSARHDSINDPWGGFPNRECTSFIAWRMHRDGYSLGVINGNAGVWDASAVARHILVDTVPTAGAIAQWHGSEQEWPGSDSRVSVFGHVAYVRQVDGDGVWVEDYNWTPYIYRLHLLSHGGQRYIHIEPAPSDPTVTALLLV